MSPDPSHRRRLWRLSRGEELYRDHLGRRVVADAEGPGSYRVDVPPPGMQIIRDDAPTVERHGAFQHSLVVVAGEGDSSVEVLQGPSSPEMPNASPSKVGWVIASQGPIRLDGRPTLEDSPRSFPVPFFEGVAGEGLDVRYADAHTRWVHTLDITDHEGLKASDWKVQNASDLFDLDSTFVDGTPLAAKHMSHLNAASWNVEVPEGAVGLILWRTHDRFHGRQRARVLIDGRSCGWWYDPEEDRVRRWGVSRFGCRVEPGSRRITIDPPAGAPLWDFSRIETVALMPGASEPT